MSRVLALALCLATSASAWTVSLGEQQFSAPTPAARSGVARVAAAQVADISNYYYAFGPEATLSAELKSLKVTSEKWGHIFYIPQNVEDVLARAAAFEGARDWKLSALQTLEAGAQLQSELPTMEADPNYENPLNADQKENEKKIVESVSTDTYAEYLEALVANNVDGIPSRDVFNREATLKAQALMKSKFEALGYKTFIQEFMFNSRSSTVEPSANVVACLPGKSADTLSVTGHLDSRGGYNATSTLSPHEPTVTDAWAPGANDDGSGSAAVLELARVFKMNTEQAEKSMFFIGYGAEEQGLHGSRAFVQELKNLTGTGIPAECFGGRRHEDTTHENIQMDMIGFKKDKTSTVETVIVETCVQPGMVLGHFGATGDATCPEDRPDSSYIARHQLAASQEYNGDTLKIKFDAGVGGSDHVAYLEEGLRAVQTIDEDFSIYDCYHKACDTIENGIDYPYVKKILKMNTAVMQRMAYNPTVGGTYYDMPAAEGKYVQGEKGAECALGEQISTVEECREAIKSLNLTLESTEEWTGKYSKIPAGCSYRAFPTTKPQLHFNTHKVGSGQADRTPICKERETRYYLGDMGTICPETQELISETECAQAMFALEVEQNFMWTGKYSKIPGGCSYKANPGFKQAHGHWNTATGGASADRQPICKSPLMAEPITACPWSTQTKYDKVLQCMDGSMCIGWSCCVGKGGRARCPLGYTNMCAQPMQCGGGRDYCCSAGDCSGSGGIRGCEGIDATNGTNPNVLPEP